MYHRIFIQKNYSPTLLHHIAVLHPVKDLLTELRVLEVKGEEFAIVELLGFVHINLLENLQERSIVDEVGSRRYKSLTLFRGSLEKRNTNMDVNHSIVCLL
jgi:hypothetical protein